jgi:hypothetical protein
VARIRTIKPDFWSHEKILGVKPLTRLLFIGMWNFADDYGRMAFSPITIKARVFPNDEFSVAEIRDMLLEMSSVGLIVVYSAKDKEFLEITGWEHQKIDKRQASKIPGPYGDESEIRRIPPTSADLPRTPPIPAPVMEGNGMDSEANASGAEAPPDPAIPEREYFRARKKGSRRQERRDDCKPPESQGQERGSRSSGSRGSIPEEQPD